MYRCSSTKKISGNFLTTPSDRLLRRPNNCTHWRRQLCVTGARAPSTSKNLFFSVHFRAAQSLTAALCGRFSKHLFIIVSCYSRPICDKSCSFVPPRTRSWRRHCTRWDIATGATTGGVGGVRTPQNLDGLPQLSWWRVWLPLRNTALHEIGYTIHILFSIIT